MRRRGAVTVRLTEETAGTLLAGLLAATSVAVTDGGQIVAAFRDRHAAAAFATSLASPAAPASRGRRKTRRRE